MPWTCGEPGQRVRVEREHRSGEQPGDAIAGPGRRPARRSAQAVSAKPAIRTRLKTSTGEPPSQCSGAPISAGTISGSEKASVSVRRVEDVGVEQPGRGARQLVRHPRQDPLVQLGVAVVVARQGARRGGQRPGMDDGQQHAECWGEPPAGAGRGHGRRLIMSSAAPGCAAGARSDPRMRTLESHTGGTHACNDVDSIR